MYMFDTQTTDEFGNTQYTCEHAQVVYRNGRWEHEPCECRINYEPDVDLLTDQYVEDQQKL